MFVGKKINHKVNQYSISKDMTRRGCDYLQAGNVMEIFRRNNVRFIAVNNGFE